MQIVTTPLTAKIINRYDSSQIRQFLENKKLLLLDFWFIGCRPCVSVFNGFDKLKRDYPETALNIIAFNPFDLKSEIFFFKTKNKFGFDMQYDALHLNLFYQVQSYPCTILVGKNGEILYRSSSTAGNTEAELRNIIEQQLLQVAGRPDKYVI